MAEETPATLVARFLRANHYSETLDSFLAEANLPPSTGADTSSSALTIESVLAEKRVFDAAVAFERIALDDAPESGWLRPAPSTPQMLDSLPAANLLNASMTTFLSSPSLTSETTALLASTAARGLHFLSPTAPHKPLPITLSGFDSPVLSWTLLAHRYLLTASMSGRLALHDLATQVCVSERRDHAKYVVRVVSWADADGQGIWVASAGWDSRVLLYRLDAATMELAAPVAEIKLLTLPESVLFVPHPELSQPALLVTRRDSTFLYYYGLPEPNVALLHRDAKPLLLLGRQNLAPHSNAWVAFTPACIALHPNDPAQVAVATSHTPHMKLIIARLLLPPPDGDPSINAQVTSAPPSASLLDPERGAAAAEARRLLATQDREDAAILSQTSTLAAQTAFSTPVVVWRPGGSGVWVNGDDGAVRGIEARTGKVTCTLGGNAGGHEPGAKVRTVWAGMVDGEEVMVSGGFDRRLVVWRCGSMEDG